MFYPEMNGESNKINQFGFDELPKNLNNIPTIIYLHSQSGSRMEGLFLLDFCAKNKYAQCVFDFLGCGLSEGEYVKSIYSKLTNNLGKSWIIREVSS